MQSFFTRTTKTLIRLRECAAWFEFSLGAHVKRYVFSRCGSFYYPSLFAVNSKFLITEGPVDKNSILVLDSVRMKFGTIYVFGAVAGNTTDEAAWDIIKVYGSMLTVYKPEAINCCFMYQFQNNTDIIQTPIMNLTTHFRVTNVTTFHLTCRNIWNKFRDLPDRVGLSLSNESCSKDIVAFKEIYKPLKEVNTTSLVLTTQVVFGTISAELIIEWMEAYKYLGVDKVISYYYSSLNENALKVLKYYRQSGFVDLYKFIPAAEGKYWKIVCYLSLSKQHYETTPILI